VTAIGRHNVRVSGRGDIPMMFAHGFGCDQNMWRHVAPSFEEDFRTVLFDFVGAGGSSTEAYDPDRYSQLSGYAEDVIDIIEALGLKGVVFVGHSVSAMIGIIAASRKPDLFSKLVLVAPSPRYIDDEGYVGGFTAGQIEELLVFLGENPMAWSRAMAPAIMGNPERPELGEELTDSFCRMDPQIARSFARVTFTADNRADLRHVTHPTLILQCSDDIIAPLAVGDYLKDQIACSRLVVLNATGHCPNLSAPGEVVAAIRDFV